eukprot:c16200_g1_i1 orf=129-302(+)
MFWTSSLMGKKSFFLCFSHDVVIRNVEIILGICLKLVMFWVDCVCGIANCRGPSQPQ